MVRGARGIGVGSGAFVITMAAAMTASTNASAYKPFRSPAARANENPNAGSVPCGKYPGGATSQVNCAMTYRKGQVISNVQIVPVFWTYNGKTVDSTITAWAPPYMSALVNSGYLDLLSEYSTTSVGGKQTVTRGTTTPPYTITPTVATTNSVQDSDIASELDAQVQAGNLPAIKNDAQGKPNTLYVIFFPSGVTITDPNGSASCQAFCGYHASGSNYLYAVIPDLSEVQTYTLPDGGSVTEPCGYGCAYQAKTKPEVEWFNGTISHEIGEAVSDPVGGKGWYDQTNSDMACGGSASMNQPGGGEIGDVCVGFWDDEYGTGRCEDTAIVPGTNIAAQQTWSNKLMGCAVSNPALSPQCPPGGCVDGGAGPVSPGVDAGGGDVDATAPGPGSDASTGPNDASLGSDSTVPTSGSDAGGINPIPPPTSNPTPTGPDGSSPISAGSDGGNQDFGPGGGSSGCGCTTVPVESSSPLAFAGALAALVGFGSRRSRRKR